MATVDPASDAAGVGVRRGTIASHRHAEIFRETTIMVLYVSVVEIAELAAINENEADELLGILWGTALGLALAHWFAFRLAARAFRGEHVTRHDTAIAAAQVGGALFVAAVTSLPILFFSDERAQQAVRFMPPLIIGAVGFVIAREGGRSRVAAAFYGLTALAVGVLVALVKNSLGH